LKAANCREEDIKREAAAFDALEPGEDMVGLEQAFAAAAEEYRPDSAFVFPLQTIVILSLPKDLQHPSGIYRLASDHLPESPQSHPRAERSSRTGEIS
jgi:hypothetical protein